MLIEVNLDIDNFPESCVDCPFREHLEYSDYPDEDVCQCVGEEIKFISSKLKNCPLEEVQQPSKIDLNTPISKSTIEYARGWNDAIDHIHVPQSDN